MLCLFMFLKSLILIDFEKDCMQMQQADMVYLVIKKSRVQVLRKKYISYTRAIQSYLHLFLYS